MATLPERKEREKAKTKERPKESPKEKGKKKVRTLVDGDSLLTTMEHTKAKLEAKARKERLCSTSRDNDISQASHGLKATVVAVETMAILVEIAPETGTLCMRWNTRKTTQTTETPLVNGPRTALAGGHRKQMESATLLRMNGTPHQQLEMDGSSCFEMAMMRMPNHLVTEHRLYLAWPGRR